MDFWAAMKIPKGLIAIWYGTNLDVPAGWAICNGDNGTPDLKKKFVRCSGIGLAPHDTGGAETHTHTATGELVDTSLEEGDRIIDSVGTGDYHDGLANDEVDVVVDVVNHLPTYYVLCYIMKI